MEYWSRSSKYGTRHIDITVRESYPLDKRPRIALGELMEKGARDPLCDVIEKALDETELEKTHDLLFTFSLRVLAKIYPEFANEIIGFSEGDINSVRQKFKGMKPLDVFPAMEQGRASQRNLLSNLYQAIQENSDLDGVSEMIYGLWETLEREGHASVLISDALTEALRINPIP